jgi:hypothetical protein
MKNTDPSRIEVKGYVFIMLMRTANMLKEQSNNTAKQSDKKKSSTVKVLT